MASNRIMTLMNSLTKKSERHNFITISPDTAQQLLTLNTNNRPIYRETVVKYANEMKEGTWLYAGHTIMIANDMTIIDGQHKLLAIIESDTTQVFHIETGFLPAVRNVLDNPKLRSKMDTVSMAVKVGTKNERYDHASTLAGAINLCIIYDNSGGKNVQSTAKSTPNNQQVDQWLSFNKNRTILMQQSVEFAHSLGNKYTFLVKSSWAFIHFILCRANCEKAVDFMQKLARGEDISLRRDSQIYVLREKLLLMTATKGVTYRFEEKLKIIFRCWNNWRKGKTMTKVSMLTDSQMEKPI